MSRFKGIFNKVYRTMPFFVATDVYANFTETVQNILFKTTVNCFLSNVKKCRNGTTLHPSLSWLVSYWIKTEVRWSGIISNISNSDANNITANVNFQWEKNIKFFHPISTLAHCSNTLGGNISNLLSHIVTPNVGNEIYGFCL